MKIISDLKPIGTPVAGELISFSRSGGLAIAVVTSAREAGVSVVILSSPHADDQFAQREVVVEKTWGSYGTDWVLELIPGPATARSMSRVVEAKGCITRTASETFMSLGGFDQLFLHLDTWAIDSAIDYKGLIYSDWRIWLSDEVRLMPGGKPLIDWHLPEIDKIISK